MAARSAFYSSGSFQRGGVPLAVLPAQILYPTTGFSFKPVFVSAGGSFQPAAYGDPLGWSTAWIPGVRYTRSDLTERKANVSTYDHYDAVKALISAGRNYTDIEAFPNYSQFTAIASNDAAALLKTAYWLSVGFLALNDTSLRDAANERLEVGIKAGVDVDAAQRNLEIKSTYDSAYLLLDKAMKRHGGSNEVSSDALEQLRKGTNRTAIATRIDEAQKQAASRKEVEDEIKKPDPDQCPAWHALIPGYCAAHKAGELVALGGKVAGVVLAGGLLIWGVRKLNSQPRSNPLSSAYNPDKKPPMPRKAVEQENALAKTVFVRSLK